MRTVRDWLAEYGASHENPTKDLQFLLIGPLWLLAAAYRKIGLSY